MSKWPKDYEEYVLKDIERYKDIAKPKKTGLIERYMKKSCPPEELHPNPKDEFSMESIGPNFTIVQNYVADMKRCVRLYLPIFEEAVVVEKMEPDGYMIINGHHRWLAALRAGVDKLHIQIVNLVHEEDMHRMLDKSENTKRVSFDLDEVLLTADESKQAQIIDHLFSRRIKERLRTGAPELIKTLQEKGYDVWVYTAGYNSEEYMNDFFSMYEIEIDGVVNGVNAKRKQNTDEIKRIREKMESKYKTALHIDSDTVLVIDHSEKAFEQYEISKAEENWANGVVGIIENLAVSN